MPLQFSDTDGTGALRAGGATVKVAKIDRTNGVITTDAAVDLQTSIAGIAVTDFVFPQGDYGKCLQGLEDWLPVTNRATKLAAAFNGVTRNVDAERLGGLFLDGTKLGGLDEILITGAAQVAMHGGRISHIFMNPMTAANLQLTSWSKLFAMQPMNTRVMVDDAVLDIGFSGFRVIVGGQPCTIYTDRNWPLSRIHMLTMSTWKLRHAGAQPIGFLGEPWTGKIVKMAETEPSMESRVGGFMALGCSAPAHNLVAQVPTS
jgi:hypothetical protein